MEVTKMRIHRLSSRVRPLAGAALLGALVAAGVAEGAAPAPAPAPAGSFVIVPGTPPTGEGGVGLDGSAPSMGNIGIVIGGPRGVGTPIYAPSDGATLLGTDLYVVQPGDTLWDLCGYFFGNPYLWPKIWAYNPVITNPHWIYPGDVLRLAPELATIAPSPVPGPSIIVEKKTPVIVDTIYLHKIAYVTSQEFEKHGEVTGSTEDKFLLTVYDTIYIQYEKEKDLPAVGDLLTIYNRTEGAKGRVDDRTKEARKLGSLVSIKGKAKVTRVERDSGMVTAEITDAVGTIERGHRAGPFKATLGVTPPVTNKIELTATVVEGIRDEEVIGKYHVIIIDRGKDDAVEIGNRLWVLRRGDGLPGPVEASRVETKDAKRTELPLERIAELRVIDVKEKTATCVVTTSIRDVQLGDKLLMRKGY